MMKFERYEWLAITIMISLFIFVGFIQGWSVSLVILNMCIISAIMTMGVNISWGYAGVINFGVMGFLAMGGLAAVIVSYPPITESWQVGGKGLGISFILLILLVISVMFISKNIKQKRNRYLLNSTIIIFGIIQENQDTIISIKGIINRCAYGASKAAVIGMTKALAADFVQQNVRVNAICPGTVDTPSLEDRMRQIGDIEKARKDFIARQPMGRLGQPEEIAEAAVYLASDEAKFVTGQTIIIDGGITI